MTGIRIGDAQIEATKQFTYRNGRLLERQLFGRFFGETSRGACVRALQAYQNEDGGFGNGIEPDLLCPDSTAIGAETAMFVMDLLEIDDTEILEPLLAWVTTNLSEDGTIRYSPAALAGYPHQPWWDNPDPDRVLTIAGFLGKWGMRHEAILRSARIYHGQTEMPGPDNYYAYPHFVYLKYCGETAEERAKLAWMVSQLPVLLDRHADHFPLFTRAWYHALDLVPRELAAGEARKFLAGMQEDGGLKIPYPDLPHWRPIWTVDGLILLQEYGLL